MLWVGKFTAPKEQGQGCHHRKGTERIAKRQRERVKEGEGKKREKKKVERLKCLDYIEKNLWGKGCPDPWLEHSG